jgi:hypothetical protein
LFGLVKLDANGSPQLSTPAKILNSLEVAELKPEPAALAVNVYLPGALSESAVDPGGLPNVAIPATAFTGPAPDNVPVEGASDMGPVNVVATDPPTSAWTCTGGTRGGRLLSLPATLVMFAPATAFAGCVRNCSAQVTVCDVVAVIPAADVKFTPPSAFPENACADQLNCVAHASTVPGVVPLIVTNPEFPGAMPLMYVIEISWLAGQAPALVVAVAHAGKIAVLDVARLGCTFTFQTANGALNHIELMDELAGLPPVEPFAYVNVVVDEGDETAMLNCFVAANPVTE